MDHLSTAKKLWIKFCRKVTGEDASPEFIARGWAIGMFYGFLIPLGGQLICSIPTSILLKGSRVGAVLGTFATNHFTIFFIYPMQCWLGNLLMGGTLSYQAVSSAMDSLLAQQDWQTLLGLGEELVLSFFIGGALFAAITTPVTYYVTKDIVLKYRARKAARLAGKQSLSRPSDPKTRNH